MVQVHKYNLNYYNWRFTATYWSFNINASCDYWDLQSLLHYHGFSAMYVFSSHWETYCVLQDNVDGHFKSRIIMRDSGLLFFLP